ncbi:MAG: hypothetical protein HUU38_12135 [Anaerolineales bacterium]|nr:hypothetical protein [Anaerolineales bacterium]
MPRQNRVTPFGQLIATPERGTLMGNRGSLHNAHGQIRRPFVGQRWIICLLAFKGWHRTVMTPGQYTELFFLDEATALAAGHRPCAECQRPRFNLFRETWARANPQHTSLLRPPATLIDAVLHGERALSTPGIHLCPTLDDLPNGTYLAEGENAFLVLNRTLLRWTPAGYTPHAEIPFPARVLTPASVVRTLAAGYPVEIHPSASALQR